MRRLRPVEWAEFTTSDDGPLIAGRRAGSGPPVLLLHGGPGLGFDYVRELAPLPTGSTPTHVTHKRRQI